MDSTLILPKGGLSLSSLDEQLLAPGTKGLPIRAPLRQGAIGVQGWNVLRGDTSFPVALLKGTALRHNLDWMRRFCDHYGVLLAPHGKTTMSPQLFGAQLANGAWGMTLASVGQVLTAHGFGVRRVLLANQVTARADIISLLDLLHGDPDFECTILADSAQGVALLAQQLQALPLARPLPLLVELGIAGKRAGCRSSGEALALARTIAATPGLALAGFEGYEGLLVSSEPAADLESVDTFLARLVKLVRQADGEGLFGTPAILLSAGGSSYFDLVARALTRLGPLSRPLQTVLRSGCYLTSDHGLYQRLVKQLEQRELAAERAFAGPGLRPALEVWSVVLSCPEPGLAILGMGKRDASFDAGLPQPLLAQRAGAAETLALDGCDIVKLNDQHAYLRLAQGLALEVGDLVGCGISHPCTTFDKWKLLLIVNDRYDVQYAVNTCFS